ncbi:46155_t:CDS:2 [Gigaspora margarita]|uniref:46155_t:CDS:1 n=1 Tax=Gigaspora margarita TaxID=4874 RepID=A0ABN7UNQ6_GIGMA|nr:46155_t:CDS:2 [Gigaspora margarita]
MANSETLSDYSKRLEQCLNKYNIKRFDDLYLSKNDLEVVGNRVKVVDNTPLEYVSLYKMCHSLEPDKRPTLDTILNELNRLSVETTIEFIENKNDLDKPIAQQENINSCNAPDHNEDKNGTHGSNFSTESSNPSFLMQDFPFDIKKFDDSFNLIKFDLWIKEVEAENLPRKLLIDALESLSVAPEYKIYGEDVVSHLELRLQTLNATLEKIYYLFPLQYEFRDKLLSNLKTYIDLYYRLIYNYYPNYNIIFLLINLRDTLQSIQVDGQKKPLKKSIIPETIINAGVSLPQNALNFLQSIDHINNLTGWYKKWRDLLSICRSLEISTRQLSNNFFQSHKEIYFLEFFWQYVLCQISDHTIPVANFSKEFLNDKTAFLQYFNKNKGPICSLNSLWFATLNLVQDLCYTTQQPVILVASYYLGLVSLRKSRCVYIKFKSLEVLYSLLLREPEQIHDVIKEKISEFCDSESKFLIDIVYKKLQLDNKYIKSKDYVSIFQGKDIPVNENIVTLLKGIIKEKLICTTLKGDFLDLDCKHVINRLAIINQKACPFCKLNIDSKLIYNFTSNAIIKGFYEKLEDFDEYIMSESENVLSESELMKKAKAAEKQQKYSDVIIYLDEVMQFYPKSYGYSVQCRKANAIWELGLRKNQETAIKLHVKARDILTSAIQLKPKDSFAYVCRGKIYLHHNNNFEALKNFESVQKFDPNNRDAFLFKLMILNKVENAEFSKIIKKNRPNLMSIISLLTTIKPRKMIFGLGNSLPVKLYSMDDSTISGYVFLKIYKKFIKAIKSCTQAIKNNDRNAIALGIRGISFYKNEIFSDAINDFNKVLDILPNNKLALGWRGKIYSSMEEYEKSLDDLNKAIDLNNEDSNNSELTFHFNKLLLTERSDVFVDRNLKDAIKLNPKESYWYCQLGALLYEQGDYNTSLKKLNYAISLFQSSKCKPQHQKNEFQRILMSETYHYRGLLYKEIGKLQMANSDFEKAKELDLDYEIPKFINA